MGWFQNFVNNSPHLFGEDSDFSESDSEDEGNDEIEENQEAENDQICLWLLMRVQEALIQEVIS